MPLRRTEVYSRRAAAIVRVRRMSDAGVKLDGDLKKLLVALNL
jgi:hypothetical protein